MAECHVWQQCFALLLHEASEERQKGRACKRQVLNHAEQTVSKHEPHG